MANLQAPTDTAVHNVSANKALVTSSAVSGRLSEFTLNRLQSVGRLDRIASLASSERANQMFATLRSISASSRSSIGSVLGLSKEAAALLASFAPYDLEATKAKVLKSIEEQLSVRFKHFFERAASLFDKLLIACLQYVVALLYVQALKQAFCKAQRQKHDRFKPDLVEEKLSDLQKWVAHSYEAVAPAYALVVFRCSKSKQQHNDQLFFESLYLALCECILDIVGQARRQQVVLEVGRMFRTPSFNSYARSLLGVRSRDTMTASELHALTQEALPKELDRKLLSYLREGPEIRPHYREDSGSTLLQPFLMDKKQVADITDPALDKQTFKLPSDLNGMFYQKRLIQKLEGVEEELAGLKVHVSEAGMAENEVTLKMAFLQKQMLQAGHRI